MHWTKKEKTFVSVVIFLVAFLDQVIKYLIVHRISNGQAIQVIPDLFNVVLAYNKGVAFGIFAGIGQDGLRYLVLGLTTTVALSAVYFFAKSETCQTLPAKIALGMILGGALGNLIDRVRLGSVVDYLDFYIGSSHWPAFNLADSCICVAVTLLLILPSKKKHSEPTSE